MRNVLRAISHTGFLLALGTCMLGSAMYISFGSPAASYGPASHIQGATGVAEAEPVPAMYVGGQRAQVNKEAPTTQEQLADWVAFVAPAIYGAGQVVTLAEDRRVIARTLVPAAMRRPWRWRFGDGGDALGWMVHHTYRQAGHWLIRVSAYAPQVGRWYVFDTVAITVQGEGAR